MEQKKTYIEYRCDECNKIIPTHKTKEISYVETTGLLAVCTIGALSANGYGLADRASRRSSR